MSGCVGCIHLRTTEYVAMGDKCWSSQCEALGRDVSRGTPLDCPLERGPIDWRARAKAAEAEVVRLQRRLADPDIVDRALRRHLNLAETADDLRKAGDYDRATRHYRAADRCSAIVRGEPAFLVRRTS